MTAYGKTVHAQVKARLDQIEATLATLLALCQVERGTPDTWGKAGELGYIAQELEQLEEFWSQTQDQD